jgi:tight adherence protein C
VYLLVLIGLVLSGVAAALVGRAIALPRIRSRERMTDLTAYGFGLGTRVVVRRTGLAGGLEGLARSLGGVASKRIKGLSETEMRRELLNAGMYRLTPATLIGYRLLCAACFPSLFWLMTAGRLGGGVMVLATLILTMMGWVGPMTVVRRRARARLEQIDYELPELVDLMVLTVETGMGFNGSMQIAGERFSGPLGDELRLALQEQAMGLPTDQALANMVERAPSDAMRSFTRSIRQGEALGVSIGQIMRSLADEMRDRRRASAEERAQKAPIKILFPLVGLIFPSIFVILLGPAMINIVETMGPG